MAKTKKQKQEIIKNLEQELKKARSLVFIDYYGLSVKEIDGLKKILREKTYRYLVAKKTLLRLALDNLGLKNIDLNKIKGGVGLAYGPGEENELSKLVEQFAKVNKKLTIQGGIFNSEFVEAERVKILAELPTRQELIAKAIGCIKSPVNNLVYVLKSNLRNFIYVMGAIKK